MVLNLPSETLHTVISLESYQSIDFFGRNWILFLDGIVDIVSWKESVFLLLEGKGVFIT
jgi:hypothetical protein